MPTGKLEFKVSASWENCAKENPWLSHIPEFAEKDGQKFMRSHGRSAVYRVVKEDGNKEEYVCNDCGSEILGAEIAHSIHDDPFPLSGSGRVKYETVPYCPKCEDKPNFHGSPITLDFDPSRFFKGLSKSF